MKRTVLNGEESVVFTLTKQVINDVERFSFRTYRDNGKDQDKAEKVTSSITTAYSFDELKALRSLIDEVLE